MMNTDFLHNDNAMADIRMRRILHDLGAAGIGSYWALIEELAKADNKLRTSDLKTLAKICFGKYEVLKAVVYNYDLFHVYEDEDCDEFFSAKSAPSIFKF